MLTPAGNYTLRLLFPRKRRDTSDLCVPFDLSVRLAPVWAAKMPACEGEVYPTSLDTIRYLYSSQVIDYFAVFRFPTPKDRNDLCVLI